MKRFGAAVFLVGLSVAAAGCASSGKPSAAHYVPSLGAAVRLTKNVPCFTGHQTLAGPDVVSRFHAVTAVMCEGGTRVYPGRGQWAVRQRKVAVSSVANLQRYFEQHSVTTHPKNLACTLDARGVLMPIFVDGAGHWLVPRAPVDACHHPLGFPGHRADRPVRWRVVHVERLRRLLSAPAVAAGCPAMKWGRPTEHNWGPAPVFRVHRKAASVCVYRTSARHQWIGSFVRGLRLDMSQTKRLVAALKSGPPRDGCGRQAQFAEVITTPGTTASVELGGCYRVNGGPGTANAAVVRSIIDSG